MSHFALVFLGAGIGGVLRHAVNVWALRFGPAFPWPAFPWPAFPWPAFPWPAFPWATFAVNIGGSFLMGLVMGWILRRGPNEPLRLFLATGVLGGFTTFSAFSYDLSTLLTRGSTGIALSYALGSVALALAALYAGLALTGAVRS